MFKLQTMSPRNVRYLKNRTKSLIVVKFDKSNLKKIPEWYKSSTSDSVASLALPKLFDLDLDLDLLVLFIFFFPRPLSFFDFFLYLKMLFESTTQFI